MDVTSQDIWTPGGLTAKQLRRVERGLSSVTAKILESDCDQLPSTHRPRYWRHCRVAQHRVNAQVNHNNRRQKATKNYRWTNDSEDGAALARSRIWLPSDGCRQKPRLQRQEAFRVPETVYKSDFIENDADLYRLGLLYDDEHLRGSGFNLDAIVHSDIVYNVRPVKRARKRTNNGSARSVSDDDGFFISGQLQSSTFGMREDDAGRSQYSVSTPLRVIYERDESIALTFNPPSLVELLEENLEPSEDVVSDEDEDFDWWHWDLFDSHDGFDSNTVSDLTGDDADVANGAWVVLGET